MLSKRGKMMLHLVWFLIFAKVDSGRIGKQSTNMSHPTENFNLNSIASIISPRMDFDQWKPLTGRGDPLRNDPTYDYEPPLLERVHYWADEILSQREKYPEKKSEVLVLGVSSRKPSASRPVAPVRRLPPQPKFPSKYEDFSYKFSDHYPMTILVPPPPPPHNHQHANFVEDKLLLHTTPPKQHDTTVIFKDTTKTPDILSSFALQESNLIYQSSTIKQNWHNNYNKTTNLPNNTVSSDYAGWGPTTPFDDINDAHNIISYTDNYNNEITKQPLSYYKPMLSEAPPPPQMSSQIMALPTFLPTVLPPTLLTISNTQNTWLPTETTSEMSTETITSYSETTTEKVNDSPYQTTPETTSNIKPNIIDMLGSMISMPMVTDPNRPEDNLYAHATDSIHIYKSPPAEDSVNLEVMQTMQPPPPVKSPESSTPSSRQQFHFNPHILNNLLNEKPIANTHDPYLHMRFTTPIPTTLKMSQSIKSTTESPPISSYLIIQGHSKVKTYGSKPKTDSNASQNEVPNPNETNEVKHLHPIKDKDTKKSDKPKLNRVSRAQNLKSLIDIGLGSIEIQETDLGIKYDVSDGSGVPVEIYKKGIIIDSDENNYSNKIQEERRSKR